ncbi:hypothetical protein [Nitrospirillum sp. BR 11828]|uniref:hypothetical protein n=1 Tax=Nitrospirillum sp. BR 11828 TaxID=3104325 RepID=UPI002ACAE4E9|nr:hypothetical protein [Nitrospirillum sp. BR 11828]MDZ5647153.1 hypothetical protein [Nitrospirillum sp. BR 11828]
MPMSNNGALVALPKVTRVSLYISKPQRLLTGAHQNFLITAIRSQFPFAQDSNDRLVAGRRENFHNDYVFRACLMTAHWNGHRSGAKGEGISSLAAYLRRYQGAAALDREQIACSLEKGVSPAFLGPLAEMPLGERGQ